MPLSKPDFQKQLEQLHLKYSESLKERIQDLKECCDAAARGVDVAENLKKLHFEVHKLKGSSASFGYPEVESKAKRLEYFLLNLIESPDDPNDEQNLQLLQFMSDLEDVALPDESPEDMTVGLTSSSDLTESQSILLVIADEVQAETLTRQLAFFGYHASSLPDLKEAVHRSETTTPLAIITDLDQAMPDHENPAEELVVFRGRGVPIMFVTELNDFETRLAAHRCGCTHYLNLPIDLLVLAEFLSEVTGDRDQRPYRVLIVDDDPVQAEMNSFSLEQAGMITKIQDNPFRILQSLKTFKPELMLLDLHMPGCEGHEVAAVIRQIPECATMPIIFLSAEEQLSEQVRAMRNGGEQFITKPLEGRQLVTLVEQRMRRERQFRVLGMEVKSLQWELNYLRKTLDMHGPMLVTDAQGHLVFANEAFLKLTGFALMAWFGVNLKLDSDATYPTDLWQALEQGNSWQGDVIEHHRTGHPFGLHCTVSPLLDSQDHPMYATWICVEFDASNQPFAEPRDLPRPAPEKAPGAASSNPGDFKILLVEDNPINQKIAGRILHHIGYRVDFASNGEEALNAFIKDTYDLVLMDCRMPMMDGFEATRAIRRHEAGERRVPIIAMTADESNANRENCISAGMDDYLAKPTKPGHFRDMLARYLSPNEGPEPLGLRSLGVASLDVNRFEKATGGEAARKRETLELFSVAMDHRLTQLEVAILDHNGLIVMQESQAIKSLCRELGAAAMAALADSLQRMGAHDQLDISTAMLASLQAEFKRVKATLADYLEETGSP